MSHARKIALVDLGTEFTGGQSYLLNLISLLSGVADIWLLKLSPQLVPDEKQINVKSIDLEFSRRWGRILQVPLCMVILMWLRIRHGLSMVWVNGYPEIALMPWARVIGCRAIATRHLTLLRNKPKWHWIRSGWRVHFLYECMAPAAHKIVCVSEAVAESLKKCIEPKKLAVIHNWVPVLPPPVSFARRGSGQLRLLFVGRLIRHKGAFLILDAMNQLANANGLPKVLLTVVGEGDDRQALERQAEKLNVDFVGFQNDTSSYYKRADIFVNPTMGPEGLPLVSLDAMSYGLPCIFSDLPVHREITRNGEDALLFESGNAQDLVRKLELMLSVPNLIGKYGQLARKTVEANYGSEFARRRYVEELGL